MRSSRSLSAVLAVASLVAAADTLTLKTVVRYHQSVVNSATKGEWDSTVVDATDPANWTLLAPPSFVPYENLFAEFGRTVTHPSMVRFDSTTDDMVRWVSVSDSSVPDPGTPGTYLPHRYVDSSTSAPVITRSNNSYYVLPTGNLNLSVLWSSQNVLAVGKIVGDSQIQAWSGAFVGFNIPHDPYTGWSSSTAVNYLSISSPTPARYNVEKYVDQVLAALQVSSVGQGTIDSTRAELVMYHYIFQLGGGSTGLRPRTSSGRGIRAIPTPAGFEIRTAAEGPIRIVSPEGRIVRSFAPSTSVSWDGTDASGRKLTGLWIVSSPGLGALPIVLR